MKGSLSGIRKLIYRLASLVVVLMPGVLFAAQLVGDTTPKLSGQALVNSLRKGGYVIYFRHGQTTKIGEKDVDDKELENCAIQRNLSQEGEAQTKGIGVAFKKLHIPVGAVYSSPYCRCMDSAK